MSHIPTLPADKAASSLPSKGASPGRYRWVICALLFFAATINYIDRQIVGILKPTLQAEFGWSEIDYADIVFAFQLAYAIAFLFAGRMMDWLGTKTGFTIAIVIWSLAAMAHAEAPVFGPYAATILAATATATSISPRSASHSRPRMASTGRRASAGGPRAFRRWR